jgi:signal recognition particle receptor subunit beta
VVVVSYSGKEINAKLVYYGCGLCGKTTNLESIYEAVPDTSRGKMVSMKTQSDRTLFFDLLPLDLGEIMGFKTRFLLYTVPGQVFYNATRKLVLKGADAIVFVADSEVGKMEENKESLANLRANLAEYGLSLDLIPWVLQYNKRDLPNIYTLEELNAELNAGGNIPCFEAVAKDGKGVFETFRGISHLLMEKVTRDLRRTSTPAQPAAPARTAPADDTLDVRPSIPHAAPAALPRAPQVSTPVVGRAPTAAIDYGREIELPGEHAPPARISTPVGAASPAAAPPPAPARTAAARPAAAPARAEPAVPPPARQPVAVPLAEAAVQSHGGRTAASPATQRVDAGPAPAGPGRSPAPASTPASPGLASRVESEEMIVPISLSTNGTHEIVLRIVLKLEG